MLVSVHQRSLFSFWFCLTVLRLWMSVSTVCTVNHAERDALLPESDGMRELHSVAVSSQAFHSSRVIIMLSIDNVISYVFVCSCVRLYTLHIQIHWPPFCLCTAVHLYHTSLRLSTCYSACLVYAASILVIIFLFYQPPLFINIAIFHSANSSL